MGNHFVKVKFMKPTCRYGKLVYLTYLTFAYTDITPKCMMLGD